jgi:lysophospholipase L1-like esterase
VLNSKIMNALKKFKYINLFTYLGLPLTSLAILFATLELLARLFNIAPLPTPYTHFNIDPQNSNSVVTRKQTFLKNKAADTFRIFIFGGSSIDRQDFTPLTEMLTKEFPSRHFEVINVGLDSYGTSRIRPIVKQAVQYSPDLFIVYSGHNEFLEEFLENNMLHVATKYLHKKLSRFRGYALIHHVLGKFIRKHGMKMMRLARDEVRINWADPLSERERAEIYKRYESNLDKIVKQSRSNNIEIIMSTVAYNYVDDRYISPRYYGSKENNTKHSDDQIDINSVSDEDVLEMARRQEIDPYIENRLGRYYLDQQDHEKAAEYFVNAARVDFQPFRANDISNSIVRNIAKDMNVLLADVEGAVIERSDHMIPDSKLFNDWCHLNNEGMKLMQMTFFNTIKESISRSESLF